MRFLVYMIFCLFFLFPSTLLGSSRIAVLVNNVPITTNDIDRRVSLLLLRNYAGDDIEAEARNELIDEVLRLSEARRLSVEPSESDISVAYSRFADNQGMDASGLDVIMSTAGVTPQGFKQYIRGQLAWQRLLALRYQAENAPKRPKSVLDTFHGDSTKRLALTTEYTVQQIIFVLPRSRLESGSAARIREANNFRSRFTSCSDSLELAKELRDVSVLSRGRLEVHELPERWRRELETIVEGETTRPLRTERGIELLAVCGKREVRSSLTEEDTQALLETGNVRSDFVELDKRYSAELRENAIIKTK